MPDSHYDTAQICLNGHIISEMADKHPQSQQKHCQECGAETIMACPACGAKIRGYYHVPGVFDFSGIEVPMFCHSCGRRFPWTAVKMEAAKELAAEVEGLTKAQAEQIRRSLEEIATENPRTELAATRLKRLLSSTASASGKALYKVAIDFASETAKKIMTGQ